MTKIFLTFRPSSVVAFVQDSCITPVCYADALHCAMPDMPAHMLLRSYPCLWLLTGVYRKPGPQLPGAIGAFSVGLSPDEEHAAAEQENARMVRRM
jgi:hypothetical protein